MTTNELSFSLNGINAGVAFQLFPKSHQTKEEEKEVEQTSAQENNDHHVAGVNHDLNQSYKILFPAISCNQAEIIEIRVHDHQFQYISTYSNDNCNNMIIPIGNVMVSSQVEDTNSYVGDVDVMNNDVEDDQLHQRKIETKQVVVSTILNVEKTSTCHTDHDNILERYVDKRDKRDVLTEQQEKCDHEFVEKFSFDSYDTIEDFEKVGLHRLKLILHSMGMKCGGTLQERAKRLFTLKGLKPEDYPTHLFAMKKNKNKMTNNY
jgi:Replication stress response SDE2 C-terminal